MQTSVTASTQRVRPYHLFVLMLSVYAIAILGIEVLVPISDSTRRILTLSDTALCVFFFLDFLISLHRAPRRWQYLYRWGWIDLVSSIPAVQFLRVGRLARVVRILRILRGFRATKALALFVLERRTDAAFLAASVVTLLLVSFGAIAVLHAETVPEANIKSPDDAIWWSIVTITTVGYGDRYPVTWEGRLIAVVLMTAGVGLFGTFAGFLAAWFLKAPAAESRNELRELQDQVAELSRLVGERFTGPKP